MRVIGIKGRRIDRLVVNMLRLERLFLTICKSRRNIKMSQTEKAVSRSVTILKQAIHCERWIERKEEEK
jgi:hypothetical protein